MAAAGIETVDQVRQAGRPLAGFSPALAEEERALKRFLYARVYDAAPVRAVKDEAQRVLAGLFAAYRADPSLLPPEWRAEAADPTATTRRIGDFIAGVTDRYAIARHRELVGPVELPEEF